MASLENGKYADVKLRIEPIALIAFCAMVMVLALALWIDAPSRSAAASLPQTNNVPLGEDVISGTVTSSKGPEAGVWVIAETTNLPTKFRKIVVTDDRGRYLIPDLPKANYKVWVRGYGLVDSPPVDANPGKALNLTAVIAPDARSAAMYYPAAYWYSIIKVPDKSEFPGTGPEGNGINPRMKTQADWIWQMKSGCETCHQLGDKATREIEPQLGKFNSSVDAWDHRTRTGQDGAGMTTSMNNFGRQRGLSMLADWTDRIAKGELPPVPPRPQGIERNLVLTMWDWGAEATFAHDELATDKRHPTANANGPIYGVDWGNDDFLIVDPVEHTASRMRLPMREEGVPAGKSQSMPEPSAYWGDQLYWNDPAIPNHMAMDSKGRIWMSARFRKPENQPDYCKKGHPSAELQPLDSNFRELEYYDPKTRKFTFVDVCFDSHHVQIGDDPDETIYSNGPFGGTLNWLRTKVLDETGDVRKAEGWCGAYIDVNGNGVFDPNIDERVNLRGIYGIAANPVDNTSAWGAVPGVPGRIVRVNTKTCATEVYEPPYNNPNAPGKMGFGPRGIDVDTRGVVWTALAGSGHMASFDRSKCKVMTGPATKDGQHCPEGWTLYATPGPHFKSVTDEIGVDYHYYNWVDRYNTLGLGDNIPIANGTASDSLIVFVPSTGKFIVLRVPYPMGFYQRGLDGRIDDPKAGWKGRGIYADYGPNAIWHIEGGKGTRSSLVKFQLRPDPLAK